MTKNDIVCLPTGILRQRSKKIGLITADIEKLINDMKAATLDWEAGREHEVGVALAAIQVGAPLRIVVIRNDFDNRDDETFTVFINPEITKYEGKIEHDFEGCLSVPDVYGKVPRYSKVRVRAQDEDGRYFRMTASGFLARIFQHEIDHTNGMVFIDHIKDDTDAFYQITDEGKLEKLDYEKNVRDSHILW